MKYENDFRIDRNPQMFQFIQMGCTLKVQNTMPHVYCYQGSIRYDVRTGVQIKQARYKKVLLSTAFLFHFTIASLLFFLLKKVPGENFFHFSHVDPNRRIPKRMATAKNSSQFCAVVYFQILSLSLLQQYKKSQEEKQIYF